MKSRGLICLILAPASWLAAVGPPLPEFDFTRPAVCAEWRAQHAIAGLRHTPEGLEVAISGEDPYFHGPARDFPTNTPLWLHLRLKSETGGAGQVFYFRDHPREAQSAWFHAPAGQWTTVRLALPALGPGYRLRIDPPGAAGKALLASARFESRAPLPAPEWPKPSPLDLSQALSLGAGALDVQVADRGFALRVEGRPMAVSHTRPLIGCVHADRAEWLEAGTRPARVEQTPRGITTSRTVTDEQGGRWTITQTFTRGIVPGVIDLEVSVSVDRDRDVGFLPLLLLCVGQDAFGPAKNQALFAGLEYLEDEPSSSEADIMGPESKRQVPANHKITLPLMVIQAEGRYVGVIWDHSPRWSALFDSPDRLLGTGGHVLGVLFPGSDRYNRPEGSLLPSRPERLRANEPLVLKAHLIGGPGSSVVPALQQYVRLRGLPPVPETGYSFQDYVSLAAHGWLDSKIREGNKYRHAVWQGFGAHAAADAALLMKWLAEQTGDAALRDRLTTAAREALALVPPAHYDSAAVSHVRYPVQALVFGHVAEAAAAHQAQARALLRRFHADGFVPYVKPREGTDYGRTHYTNHANGLTAQVAANLIEAATFSGDRGLIAQAVDKVRALRRLYAHGVPRGAQTWEVPLHTPDVLASAHLVHAFILAHQITGERALLDEAIYWAWTGLPFFYLIHPVGFPDPPYGCVTVYGATSWRAPVWFGRPVQWCGLVYADALYRLAPQDPNGPWKQLADGITAMGVRYTWPAGDKDRVGLLPDVWELLQQERAGPAINPGTVQANAVRLFGKGALYDCHVFRFEKPAPGLNSNFVTVHAPGEITSPATSGSGFQFTVQGWPRTPYHVLVTGFARAPQVKVNGAACPAGEDCQFDPATGRLVLKVTGQPVVGIAF